MKLVFTDQSFSYQLLRTIGHSVYGGADIGECLATAARIEEGNLESWYTEWLKTADRLRTHAEASLQANRPVSARQGRSVINFFVQALLADSVDSQSRPSLLPKY
jgi:hypothetical protein